MLPAGDVDKEWDGQETAACHWQVADTPGKMLGAESATATRTGRRELVGGTWSYHLRDAVVWKESLG